MTQCPLSSSPSSLLGPGGNQPSLKKFNVLNFILTCNIYINRIEWLWSPWDSFVIFCGHSHVQCKYMYCFFCFFSLQLSKLTVPVLKEFVKQAGIKCGTKKADLVEAIKDHFGVWFLCILKNIIDFILKICLVSYTAARASVRQRSRHGGGRLCLHVDSKEKVWDSWMHYYNKTYLAFWHFSSLKTMQTYYTPYQNRIGVKNAEIIDKVLPKPSLQYTSMISRCIVLFSLQHI